MYCLQVTCLQSSKIPRTALDLEMEIQDKIKISTIYKCMLQKVLGTSGSVDRAGSDLLMIRLNGPTKKLQLCSYKKHIRKKVVYSTQPGNNQGILAALWFV